MSSPNRPLRVLHLEENDRDAEQVRDRLERLGRSVVLERVRDRQAFASRLGSSRYDLILSDYSASPACEGLAVLEQALAAQPRTPFLFIGGAVGEERTAEAVRRGATDFVRKDHLLCLPTVVERVLAEARERHARHDAESQAEHARDRAAAILENMIEAFLLLDPNGRIISVNSAFERLFSDRRERVLGRALWDVLPGACGNVFEREIRRALAGREALEFEHFLTPPGRWLSVRATPDADGGLSLFLDDITLRKQAEIALADRERRYRLVADVSHDVIWDWNLVTHQVVWTEGLIAKLGYDEAQVAPDVDWWFDHIHPDDLARVADSVQRHIESQRDIWEEEYRFQRGDGVFITVSDRARTIRDPDGRALRMVGSMLDLSDRRYAEAALRDAEERFAFVRRSCGVGFWYCDLPFDVLLWDELVKRHFFLPPDAHVTLDLFYDRIHPDDREGVREAIARSIDGHEPYDADYRTVDPATGAERWVRAIGRTSYHDDGTPRRFDGVTIDVTAHRRAARERERLLEAAQQARDEAQAANRMKDEFLATLSHELRTPLNAIVGWVQILHATHGDIEVLEEGLEVIDRNARAQAQLIEELLDISRIVSGKLALDFQRVSLPEIIETALATAMPTAKAKGVSLQHRMEAPLDAPMLGDPNRLQQVVWNLLSNAIKFTPRGGTVQVVLERVRSQLEIRVIDNGQGIPPEFMPYVFDRFRQADGSTTRRFGGLGLGLAIVKHLVEMHGGSVRAQSPGEGQGSTFVVALPIAIIHPLGLAGALPAGEDDPAPPDGGSCGCNLQGLRVLVLDDEPDARTLMRRVLRYCGTRVEAAGSVPEALAMVESFRPDVIISDVGMPDQDGYDFIRQVRARHPAHQVPAVALTAFARAEDRMKALRAGFQIHLAKPVHPDELISVIANLTHRNGDTPPAPDIP